MQTHQLTPMLWGRGTSLCNVVPVSVHASFAAHKAGTLCIHSWTAVHGVLCRLMLVLQVQVVVRGDGPQVWPHI